jgi:hypothetical protein
MALKLADIYDYVRNRLGEGVINVELTDPHLKSAVSEGVRLINRFRPVTRWARLVGSGNVSAQVFVACLGFSPDAAGNFTLTFGSQTTASIAYSTNTSTLATNIQSALDTLFGASQVPVEVVDATYVRLRFVGKEVLSVNSASGSIDTGTLTVVTTGTGSEGAQATDGVYKFIDGVVPVSPVPGVSYIPGLQRVVGVAEIRENIANDKVDLFDPLIYIGGGINAVQGLSLYEQATGYLEEAKRTFGSEVEWQWEWRYDEVIGQRVGHLYLDVPRYSRHLYGVRCLVDITPDDDPRTGVAYVDSGMEDWLFRYTLAASKITLGRLLGKFGGIPDASGGQITTDGAELVSAGDNEAEQLRDEIKSVRGHSTPIFG